MEKYNKLISNSIIFTIGNFGSRLITLFLVPLYTYVLTTSEYGYVDLITQTINLLLPLITLELGKAALRFAINKEEKIQQAIFNNITIHAASVSIILILLVPVINYFDLVENYAFLSVVLLVTKLLNELYSQYVRGIGLVKTYAVNGILMTFITLISNIIFLLVLDAGILGYLISLILAALISNIYLFVRSNGKNMIKHIKFDLTLQKEMLEFSMPIIPSSGMWWLINGATRYFIVYFLGTSANGIYAISSRMPSIISLVSNIFTQAWQLSSFEEFDSKDREKFYSNIFNYYWLVLYLFATLMLVFLKPLISFLLEDSYYTSWQVTPFLLIGVIFQSLSGFYGIIYQASKKTKGTLITSFLAGIASLLSNSILVPKIGVIGAGFSTALGFFVMFASRIIDTRKILSIKIKSLNFISSNIIYFIQIVLLFKFDGTLLVFAQFTAFMIFLLVNIRDIITLVSGAVVFVVSKVSR